MTGIGFRLVLAHYIHLMEEERIALFVDYENLAIGARDALGGMEFDFEPIGNALAERGRVVSRRAYADWSMFTDARQPLTRSHIELIEIPQRKGDPIVAKVDEGVRGGTTAEIAAVVGVAPRTVELDWTMVKAWLRRELSAPPP